MIKRDIMLDALSLHAKHIEPSLTLSITAKAKKMKKEGIDVIGFGAGEPDFDVPENIKKAAKDAIDSGKSKYTAVEGIEELKQAIVDKFRRENNISYTTKEVMASNGGKHVLTNIFTALIDRKDEVIIPVPYWVSYAEQIKLADGIPVFCDTDNFQIKADLIENKLAKKTKMIIINSPNNPSGAVIEDDELRKIAELAVKNNIYIVSDEVYEHFVYDKKHTSIASFNDKIKDLTLTVNSASKTYAMPGWRIGYCGGPEEIITAMTDIQSQQASNPNSVAQYACAEALNGNQKFIADMKNEFRKRRDLIVNELNKIGGISCRMPDGAFYAFADISKTGLRSMEFSDRLLAEAKVAVVPGIAFGDDRYIRLSYATSMENIKKGVERIREFCGRL